MRGRNGINPVSPTRFSGRYRLFLEAMSKACRKHVEQHSNNSRSMVEETGGGYMRMNL
ncbi:MAG: hypothetical protein LBT83_08735 [Tannerella sp.]|nr:hypothetical protein [Tannerella sp.]